MESFVQLSIEEYGDLKKRAEQQDIPVEVTEFNSSRPVNFGGYAVSLKGISRVDINMRELKLQICRQNGINPEKTTVHFH